MTRFYRNCSNCKFSFDDDVEGLICNNKYSLLYTYLVNEEVICGNYEINDTNSILVDRLLYGDYKDEDER